MEKTLHALIELNHALIQDTGEELPCVGFSRKQLDEFERHFLKGHGGAGSIGGIRYIEASLVHDELVIGGNH